MVVASEMFSFTIAHMLLDPARIHFERIPAAGRLSYGCCPI